MSAVESRYRKLVSEASDQIAVLRGNTLSGVDFTVEPPPKRVSLAEEGRSYGDVVTALQRAKRISAFVSVNLQSGNGVFSEEMRKILSSKEYELAIGHCTYRALKGLLLIDQEAIDVTCHPNLKSTIHALLVFHQIVHQAQFQEEAARKAMLAGNTQRTAVVQEHDQTTKKLVKACDALQKAMGVTGREISDFLKLHDLWLQAKTVRESFDKNSTVKTIDRLYVEAQEIRDNSQLASHEKIRRMQQIGSSMRGHAKELHDWMDSE